MDMATPSSILAALQNHPKDTLTQLRLLVDLLLSHDSTSLDQFEWTHCMTTLSQVYQQGNREVKMGVINNLGVLMLNLSHRPSLVSILSQGLLHPILLLGVDMLDDELVDYYIAFLKQLTQLLTSCPDQYLTHNGNQPVLSMAMLFSRHPSSMVRTTFRNIVLSMLRCQHPLLISLFCSMPYCLLWNNLTLTLASLWQEMDGLIDNYHSSHSGRLQSLMDESQDTLFFFQDVFYLNIPEVSTQLANAFLWNCVSASLLQSFTFNKKGHLTISLAMLQLQESLSKMDYAPLLYVMIKCLYQHSLEPALYDLLQRSPSPLISLRDYGCVNELRYWQEYSAENVDHEQGKQSLVQHYSLCLGSDTNQLFLEVERVLGLVDDYSWLALPSYQQHPHLQSNTVSQVLSSFMFCKDDNLLYSSLSLMHSALRFEPTRQFLLDDHLVLHLETMLATFRKEPPVRVCTAKTLGQCLEHIYGCSSMSQERLFTHSTVSLFNQVFLFQVNSIYEILKNPLVVDHFIHHFEQELSRHYSTSYLSLDNHLTYRHLIYYDESVMNSLAPEYRLALTLFDQARSLVQCLFILARLKALLRGEELSQEPFQRLQASVYNQLSPDQPLPTNKHDMVPCKVLDFPRWQAYCVTEDVQHLVLAQKKEQNVYTVRKALCLKHSQWHLDKNNKKQLVVLTQGVRHVLLFDSRSKAISIHNTLDYNQKQAKQFDMSIILSYLNKLEQELVPYSE